MSEEEINKSETKFEQIQEIEESKDGNQKTIDEKKKSQLFDQLKLLILVKMMRDDSEPAEIIPNLYLGSLGAAFMKKKLLANNIKKILTACDQQRPPFKEFSYLTVSVADSLTQSIIEKFEETNLFISQAIESQQNILVHCFAGKSRSTSFVIAYLIKQKKMKVDEALDLIKQKRPIAQPNKNFIIQLNQYYDSLYSQSENKQNDQQTAENQ